MVGMRLQAVFLSVGSCFALAACQTTVEQEPRVFAAEATVRGLKHVFEPMNERASVAADVLEVHVSRQLWDRFSHPSDGVWHALRFEPGPPSTYRFFNKTGGLSVPLKFVIGEQTWLIVKEARIFVHGGGAPRLDIQAKGSVIVSKKGQPPRQISSLEVSDGKWEERL